MNRIRKLCRGSGRAFALIFAASVVWLLLDMAALKFSFSEISSGAKALQEEAAAAAARKERAPPEHSVSLDGFRGEPRRPPPRSGMMIMGGGGRSSRGGEEEGAGEGGQQRPEPQQQPAVPSKAAPPPEEGVGLPVVVQLWRRPRPSVHLGDGEAAAGVSPSPSRQRATPAAPKGLQETQQQPRVTLAPNKVPQKVPRPLTKGSRGRKEVLSLKVGFVPNSSLPGLKLELSTGSQAEPSQGSPPLLTAGVKIHNENLSNATRSSDLPVSRPAVSKPTEGQGASLNAVDPGKLPKEDGTQMAPAKDVPPGNKSALVTFPAAQNPQAADGKRNFTIRQVQKTLQPIDDKSQDNQKVNNVAKKPASLKAGALATKAILVEEADQRQVHRTSLVDKGQLRKINVRDSAIRLAENTRLHKVLTLDRTLSPRDPKALGQFGRPAVVPGKDQEEAKRKWGEGNFNVYLSDLIPVDRAIDDTRPAGCSDLLVHDDLPTTSIIICFVDEVWSALLRSVHSVLNRSPPQLIKEIILVDDFSTKAYLKDNLDKYMAQFAKVRVLHLKERHGLIRARLVGAEIAQGDILTFLDSHVECNVGWLEPLLDRIYFNRKKVACPVIEVISDKDMSYMTVDSFQRGVFTWPMNFGWKAIPPDVIRKNKIKETDIIRCPVMAGGLFSIDKKYFFELGTYDPGLDVWGGENMEISFKVWMCGGEIEIIPCSRVGHIFRNDNPYSFPKDRVTTVERNLARVAEVWLDEYKDLFYGHSYHLVSKNMDVGNLTQQRELRKKLQCKSFKWYLQNIYPDLKAPLVKAGGLMINVALAKCITMENSSLTFETCNVNNQNQKFNYTWLRLIQHEGSCVAPIDVKGRLGLHLCDKRNNRQKWLHKSLVAFYPKLMDHFVLESHPRATCLEADPSQTALRTNICSASNPYQKWQFENYYSD